MTAVCARPGTPHTYCANNPLNVGRPADGGEWLCPACRDRLTGEYERCPQIAVLPDVLLKADRIWTCAQRAGHSGRHNELIPADGCTAWADHCPRCAEHPPCAC